MLDGCRKAAQGEKMEIRELDKKDLKSLLELYMQLDETNKALSFGKSETIWKEIAKNKNIKYIGAVDNGKVVSTCYCVIIPNITNFGQSICFIENVVTNEKYRRQGLAKKVVEKAIEIARRNNCYKVILQSGVKRTEAHKFYENMGFDGNSKKAFDMRIKS